jgi:succinoglycan biosynthesis transport protein ExoP
MSMIPLGAPPGRGPRTPLSRLIAGIAAVLAFARAPRGFSNAEEIEAALNLPVIGSTPRLPDGIEPLAEVLRNPYAAYAESVRQLYFGLLSTEHGTAPATLAIVSAMAGEGRSTLAASLGRLLAGEGRRILLIDCDWRHPDLHRLFRLPNDIGIISLLLDEQLPLDDAVHNDSLSGLDVITTGRWQAVPPAPDRMRQVLAVFAKSYDLILLDLPPTLLDKQTLFFAALAEKVLFAIRWRQTLRKNAINAIEQILNNKGNIAGIALTCVDADLHRHFQVKNSLNDFNAMPPNNVRP